MKSLLDATRAVISHHEGFAKDPVEVKQIGGVWSQLSWHVRYGLMLNDGTSTETYEYEPSDVFRYEKTAPEGFAFSDTPGVSDHNGYALVWCDDGFRCALNNSELRPGVQWLVPKEPLRQPLPEGPFRRN